MPVAGAGAVTVIVPVVAVHVVGEITVAVGAAGVGVPTSFTEISTEQSFPPFAVIM